MAHDECLAFSREAQENVDNLQEGPYSTVLTKAMRNMLVRGAPASLKCSVVALLCSSGKAVPELGSLLTVGLI